MGNKQARPKAAGKEVGGTSATLAVTDGGEDSLWEEEVEIRQCCGMSMEKVRRKRILWENVFVENCSTLTREFPWAVKMIELARTSKLPKLKYFAEIAALKREADVEAPTETEQLATPAELSRFKDSLKRSVILSVSASKASSVNAPRIASMIEDQRQRSRITIERSAYLNSDSLSHAHFDRRKSASSKGSHRRSIISFMDGTISSVLGNEREISRQTARDLQIFLKFSMILERHLSDQDCILARIRRLFLSHFEETYRDTEYAGLRAGDFVDDVKQFLVLLRESVFDFYNLGSFAEFYPGNLFIANDENVLSACTAILFKDPVFYTQAFAVACNYSREREGKLSLIIDSLHGSSPERFQVAQRFCLGAKTVKACLGSGPEGSEVESGQLKDLVVENEQPYRVCMDQLRELEKSRSPISKMKIIVGCAEGISSEIERFYDRNGLRREKWVLDADQVLAIFCYVIAGARVPHLLAHLFLLENFATSHQMISVSGYYLSVMGGAVEHLETEFSGQVDPHSL